MAINDKLSLRAQGEFTDEGRQEFIVAIGCYGIETTVYVGLAQMREFVRQLNEAMASADRHERETISEQKEAA